ncbi:MAG: hypothetical protein QM578_09675 [Pantoea sp.]|uniref:hypothetical protein n=1 Tax=Pantoea sp. TaxID=69393 RepID=UPI0039E4729A
MNKQELFLWGVQAFLTSSAMRDVQPQALRKLSLDAVNASQNIPNNLDTDEAINIFHNHIEKVIKNHSNQFWAW